MKKHLIIAGIICAASIPPVYAVTKCVKLTSSTTCSSGSGGYGQSNWSATCDGVSVQGVAFCGSQNAGSVGTKSDTVKTSSSNDANKYCWCKMTSPAVSRWGFVGETTSAGACAYRCADACASYAQYDSALRSALFSGLSD